VQYFINKKAMLLQRVLRDAAVN